MCPWTDRDPRRSAHCQAAHGWVSSCCPCRDCGQRLHQHDDRLSLRVAADPPLLRSLGHSRSPPANSVTDSKSELRPRSFGAGAEGQKLRPRRRRAAVAVLQSREAYWAECRNSGDGAGAWMSDERLLWGAAGAAAGAAVVVPAGEAELPAGLLERRNRHAHGRRGARQREPREGAKQLLRHHHGRPPRPEAAAGDDGRRRAVRFGGW